MGLFREMRGMLRVRGMLRMMSVRSALLFAALATCFLALGLVFLISGLEQRNHAIRTTATVARVEKAAWLVRNDRDEYTLRFVDQAGQTVTTTTEQVWARYGMPQPGDKIEIYYAATNPDNVSDVRFGPPGSADLSLATVFTGSAAVLMLIVFLFRYKRLWGKLPWGHPSRHARPVD